MHGQDRRGGILFRRRRRQAMAVRMPDLAAAVPFYGAQPAAEDVAKIKAPLLIHYAGARRAHQRGLARRTKRR